MLWARATGHSGARRHLTPRINTLIDGVPLPLSPSSLCFAPKSLGKQTGRGSAHAYWCRATALWAHLQPEATKRNDKQQPDKQGVIVMHVALLLFVRIAGWPKPVWAV